MKSKHLISAFSLLGVSILSAPAVLAADFTGWYGGISVGQSEVQDSSLTDDTETGWKLFAGYQLNKYFALEGSYTNLGRFDNSIKVKDGVYLDAVGVLPLADNFSVFGKLGAYSIKTEVSASGTGISARNSDLTYGIGLSYAFTKEFGIRAEWERFEKVGDSDKTGQSDIDLLSLGLTYQFY